MQDDTTKWLEQFLPKDAEALAEFMACVEAVESVRESFSAIVASS